MTIGVKLESEDVPAGKKFHFSTRDNSDYKWQNDPNVIGALEVPSVPVLDLHCDFVSKHIAGKEEAFDAALEQWENMKLREDFQKAAEAVPKDTCCCGLITDDDESLKNLVPTLNKGWIRNVNQRLLDEKKGFKLDVYLWQWNNATGKTETLILLIRFFAV